MSYGNNSRLQAILQAAVQSVQWTYSLFWHLCPQQGILVWGDGYYNGAIKTRKTVQTMEVSTEEASLERSQQLRELYDTLSAGESNLPAKRLSTSLSPEDLTESEWYYLMCVSFSFPPGIGLPGSAYAKGKHIWLTGANEVDSKVFTRAILAKSAQVQTVVCIPLLDGVLELGTTDRILEDLKFIEKVKSFFRDYNQEKYVPSKPDLSEQSTSNPDKSSSNIVVSGFQSPTFIVVDNEDREEDYDDDDDDEDEDDVGSDYEDETERNRCRVVRPVENRDTKIKTPEPTELMQIDMSEDIRFGSTDDGSNNLDWDANFIKVPHLEEFTNEDIHYSRIVSTILHRQSSQWSESSSTNHFVNSFQSAFTAWSSAVLGGGTTTTTTIANSQRILKYVLFSLPFLHGKSHDASTSRKVAQQDDISANHVLAERRRREKLNKRFIVLRSLVPFVTKMDKASILGDTIEYVKQLKKKIEDLEGKTTHQVENIGDPQRTAVTNTTKSGKKMKVVESGSKTKSSPPPPSVEVSIIECDALVEVQCKFRDGLLLDVMQKLRELRVEVTTAKSSLNNGIFVAELRAKVKENFSGKKVSIMEVKKAMNQIIPQK